jgi:AcrR family transcriptional regulator
VESHDVGLRERKKLRTREAIIDAAMRLFAEHGFDRTTIADIAREADVAPRTFFAYFPSKEDVVFHDFEAMHSGLTARLLDRPASETTVDALRAWVADAVVHGETHDERKRCQRTLLRDTPSLKAHERVLLGRFEAVLEQAVAADLGDEPGTLRPRLVAAAFMAALTALGDLDEEAKEEILRQQDAMGVLDDALTFLRGGVRALQRRTRAAQS